MTLKNYPYIKKKEKTHVTIQILINYINMLFSVHVCLLLIYLLVYLIFFIVYFNIVYIIYVFIFFNFLKKRRMVFNCGDPQTVGGNFLSKKFCPSC